MKTYENFNQYEYKRKMVIEWLNEIKIHIIPENLRVVDGTDSYKIAIKQAEDFLKGKIELSEISKPENTLRNIMMLWGIDKIRCKKRIPNYYSVGMVKNMQWRDGIYSGFMSGWRVYLIKEPINHIPDKYMSMFKVKNRDKNDGDNQCVVEIIDQKANVYLI